MHNGNERAALLTLNTARELGKMDQIILGTGGRDRCSRSSPQDGGDALGAGQRSAEVAFCFATGNTARQRELDVGLIERGYSADFVLMDQAQHSGGKTILESVELGNLPGVGMTIIDEVRSQRSRNTPPAWKIPEIMKG